MSIAIVIGLEGFEGTLRAGVVDLMVGVVISRNCTADGQPRDVVNPSPSEPAKL